METLAELTVAALKEHCREQTSRFYKHETYITGYCYELFRRFFENNCPGSLNAIYSIYKPLVALWVKNHKYYNALGTPDEDLVLDSMSQFVFAIRKYPFSNFKTVAVLLAYWRKCVHSIIMMEWRNKHTHTIPLENEESLAETPEYEHEILARSIWQRIEELLPAEKDCLLARLVFIYGMKPREIVRDYAQTWKSTDEVRVDQQRIKRHLQKDEYLAGLLKE